ncbi:hypothetical protein V8J82_12765 [Gymnodinialimonas sp. 2305UL16-5]|uniref:hypothetical protein n=1 Tax=Gymnodinialimonas mytili TaxID=3126503 RepID=UPI0030ABBB2D
MRGILVVMVCVLAGCGGGAGNGLFNGGGAGSASSGPFARDRGPEPVPVIEDAVIGEADASDIAPDDPSARAAAVAEGNTGDGDAVRGFTVASLGDATVSGLWIETPLVERERQATVVAPNGTTVEVTARPSGGERGSGSRLSLAAFQALGLDLTGLPTVTVIAE